ncbi:MAG: hypothetical protein IJH98_04495 [Solobacterium sp.]|nr:hypothetical protein [Solobacterium sp.]
MTTEEYFAFLHERFSAAGPADRELHLSICGYRVRILFAGIGPTEIMKLNLSNLIQDSSVYDETVFVWGDDLERLSSMSMLDEEQRRIHYHCEPDFHIFYPGARKRLSVRDNRHRETFVCFPAGEGFPRAYANKPFVNEMQWWLQDRYLIMHAAAVGIDGTGALITAPSGQGKSTLALACLLEGMDYLAEDYVLINRGGPLKGYPIFATGNMTTDSLRLIPEMEKNILYFDDERQKYLVDLTPYTEQFRDGMLLKCIIYPHLTDDDVPSIERSTSVHPFVSAVTAAAKQIKSQKQTSDSFRLLFRRLKDLPAYEMRLTPDVRKNAAALKQFLEEKG